MFHVSNVITRNTQFRLLLSISVLVALLGALIVPTSTVDASSVAMVRVSSKDAPACSEDRNASCAEFSFVGDIEGTARFEFDCEGEPIKYTVWVTIGGVSIPIPAETNLCTVFAGGSEFTVYKTSPSGGVTPMIKNTYIGLKQEGEFTVQPGYIYTLAINAHGRDYRDALASVGIEDAFNSYFKVSYPKGDLEDNQCESAAYFDLPYSGNLELSGDQDWQRIQSSVKGTMVLDLDVPADKDYQLEIRSDDCVHLLAVSQHGTGVDEQIEIPVDLAYYRVHVYGKTPEDFGGSYLVQASFSGDLDDNQCENAAGPFDLPYSGNLEFSGDQDWQQIKSPVIGKMILNLDVPDHRNYQLEIRSDDCVHLLGFSQHGIGLDEKIIIPVDSVFYRVHIYGNAPDDFGLPYTVSASFSSDLNDDPWENAEYFDMPFQGNLEYAGDQDWQKITIPAGETTLVLDVPDGINYELELWQDDVKLLVAESKNGIGVDESILITQPGTYCIHIYGVHPVTDFNAPYWVFLDGTGAVTLVKDIAMGTVSSDPTELTNVNGTLFFVVGDQLWKSDGTEAGTIQIVDAAGMGGQPSFSHPHGLVAVNDKLYFAALGGAQPMDVWATDGTANGTRRLNLVENPGNISELTKVNGNVYFVLRDCGPGSSLCDILMNLNGEILRETVASHPNIPAYSNLTNVNGVLYFLHSDYRSIATDPPTPPKLYWQLMKVSDADEEPNAIGDIPGDESSPPGMFYAADGILYFVANDGVHGPKLWRSDGSTIAMVPAVAGDVPQIGGAYDTPQEVASIGKDVYFTDGRALWMVDDKGNARGLFCIAPTTSCVGNIGHLGRVDDLLYFVHSWEYGTTLYKYDGNEVTTIKFYPAIPFPFFVPTIDRLTDVNGRLYFAANDGTSGAELWTSDGTPSGTEMVADIALGIASSDPDNLVNGNGILFFTADDAIHGTELWRTVVGNRSPTAESNGQYTINEGSSVTLDASLSSDPDSDP